MQVIDPSGTIRVPETGRYGSLHLDFSTRADATLIRGVGKSGRLELRVAGGRLDGIIATQTEQRRLDAEDTVGLTDGFPHSVTLAVNESGTRLYVDGYEALSATLDTWLPALGITDLEVNPSSVVQCRRLIVDGSGLTPDLAVALAQPVRPRFEFAAAALSPRDAHACSALREGTIRTRFHSRGQGQSGVALAAEGTCGQLRMGMEPGGDLCYRVWIDGQLALSAQAEGRWDDGNDHDVVTVVGRGAVDIYVDGYQVVHEAGVAFFRDLGTVQRVVVGADLDGVKLFGEVSEGGIFDQVLSDAQVKRLATVTPLETRALFDSGYHRSVSYRIPSLLALSSGVVLAGADRRVSIPNDAPNDIDFVLRRSLDGGATWEDMRVLIEYPGDGVLGSSVTDSVLLQDRTTGRVMVLIDMYPGGIGQPNARQGVGVDEQGRKQLLDQSGQVYWMEQDGTVVTTQGDPTEFRVEVDGALSTGGNIYAPGRGALRLYPTGYVQMIVSEDDGATWSAPRDITGQVKEEWMRFCGISPGNGIQLECGPHAGRLLVPIYFSNDNSKALSSAAIYSDDGGQTWQRGASPNDGREIDGRIVHSRTLDYEPAFTYESTLVEDSQGRVHMWMRNLNPAGRVAHGVSQDGGETWGHVEFVEALPEIFSQPNAISVDGAIVFANASQLVPYRGRGVLRMSTDDGATWAHNRVFNPHHYVYQCMTLLPDGRVGLLWEKERQGLFFTPIELSWLRESLQGKKGLTTSQRSWGRDPRLL